jgi:hypothetical protein
MAIDLTKLSHLTVDTRQTPDLKKALEHLDRVPRLEVQLQQEVKHEQQRGVQDFGRQDNVPGE